MRRPSYVDAAVTVYHGDCLKVLAELPDRSVDSVVTDPPYGIGFMGKAWDQPGEYGSHRKNGTPGRHNRRPGAIGDHTKTTARDGAMEAGRYDLSSAAMHNFQRWCQAWATECLRILRPGGHLLAFGGSRTWHRLANGIEDAGFELRDSIAWIFASGFPKSLDVAKAINQGRNNTADAPGGSGGPTGPRDGTPGSSAAQRWQGWGTGLKPAFEPIVLARRPLAGTVAANVVQHGTGALNIDACRVGDGADSQGARPAHETSATTRYPEQGAVDLAATPGPRGGGPTGRWPTNVILDETQAAHLDRQSGTRTSGANPTRRNGDKFRDTYGTFKGQEACTPARGADSGGVSRYFPTFRYEAKAPAAERPQVDGITHPTVKPLGLMRWLVRLVAAPGAVVLDPFAGSGATAEACVIEGMRCIAIERESDYLPLITSRLTKPLQLGLDLGTQNP
ncbi:hypothetical protein GCM10027059_50610 [Myceligenerans halotolerans]